MTDLPLSVLALFDELLRPEAQALLRAAELETERVLRECETTPLEDAAREAGEGEGST